MLTQRAKYSAAHYLWRLSLAPSAMRFKRSLHRCRDSQAGYLRDILRRNRNTEYGRRHDFGRIRTVTQYQASVPLSKYQDYAPYIEKVAAGCSDVLTRDPVFLFEPSSGSTGAEKLVPYNRTLKEEFLRGIAPWMSSLYGRYPGLSQGKAYWSISPAQQTGRKKGAIPIGFDDDAAYLGRLAGRLHAWMTIIPAGIKSSQGIEPFRVRTLAALLADPDLAFISIWSPSFLRILLEWYLENRGQVLAFMETDPSVPAARLRMLGNIGDRPGCFKEIWPKMCLVSCWSHGISEREAELLKDHLPGIAVQGKGLIATEAFVSLPFAQGKDPVLAVRSHFFEFISEGGRVYAAWEVEEGHIYSLLVTTGGGLYRYQLDDQVLVTGFAGDTPTIRFVGKSAMISDRFGEKLNATHVADEVNRLTRSVKQRFCMLAPDTHGESTNYTLFIETTEALSQELPGQLDAALSNNPNYRYCVELGQLGPARVFKIDQHGSRAYEEGCIKSGQRAGDIKLSCLSRHDGWSARFQGEYL